MKPFEIAGLPSDEVKNFVAGTHSDPFRVLGPHRVGDDLEIRVFRPDARAIDIVLDREAEKPIAAERIQQDGFFCATVPGAPRHLPYHVRITGRARHCRAKESVLLNSLRCNRLLCFSIQHDIDLERVRAKDTNLQIIANAVRTQHAERISMITGNKAAHLITRESTYV